MTRLDWNHHDVGDDNTFGCDVVAETKAMVRMLATMMVVTMTMGMVIMLMATMVMVIAMVS